MNFTKDAGTVLTATSSWNETTAVSSGTTVSLTLNTPALGKQWIAVEASGGNYILWTRNGRAMICVFSVKV